MRERLDEVRGVFRDAFANPALRRLVSAYALFFGAELVVWLALLVYAYAHGGASGASLMALIQLVPCAVFAPLLGALADRHRPGRVLVVGYGLQAVTMAALAFAMAAGAPTWVPYALAPLSCLAITSSRPAQAALVPAVVRTPVELTAANVLTGWSEGASGAVGPALAGVLLAVSGPALAIAASALMTSAAALLVLRSPGPKPPPPTSSVVAQLSTNLRAARSDPSTRVLLTLHAYYYALMGTTDLLAVILAVTVLGLGSGGAGYLNAAMGVGVIAAGPVTAFIVGRPRLGVTMMTGLVGSALALGLIGVHPMVVAAFVLLGLTGLAGSVFDVTARTLLQRTVASDALAGVFSVLESLMNVGLAVGVVIVRLALWAGGPRAALIVPAAVGLVLAAAMSASHPPHRRVGHRAAGADLPAALDPDLRRPGRSVDGGTGPAAGGHAGRRRDGDHARGGSRRPLLRRAADGRVSVTRQGRLLAELERGQGFGEIALVHNVPRTATVASEGDALLYALDKEDFVLAVAHHPAMADEAEAVASRHLRAQRDP